MDLSIVVPVHNEAGNLAVLQKEIIEAMAKTGFEYEIIYVDDASSDSSGQILKGFVEEDQKVKVISFERNRGQSEALLAGFKNSQGRWILTLDADGQNPPEDFSQFIPFCKSYDFITGIRKNRKDSFIKKASSWVAKIFRRLVLGDTTEDTGCSLRMFKREIIETIPDLRNFHRFFTFLVRLRGFSVKETYVQHRQRQSGQSNYRTWGRLWQGRFDLWSLYRLKKRMVKHEINR
ncbi:MAG: glycosyltransferase family 2 protein [Candidatus Omnitrophica bacterium]|nr:glycosyltransferase family 2 protein [Candidatus Omnitrophota bacterium]